MMSLVICTWRIGGKKRSTVAYDQTHDMEAERDCGVVMERLVRCVGTGRSKGNLS